MRVCLCFILLNIAGFRQDFCFFRCISCVCGFFDFHIDHKITPIELYDIMSLSGAMNNNLKLLRKKKGYTQIAVQMKTGIEQALLSKFENDERIPPTETLIRLADFYNVSIDYILCRTDNPNVNK